MVGFIAFLFLVMGGAVLTVRYIVAKKFEEIAKQKGYGKEAHAFAMCFWLGVFGALYVIALPDRMFLPDEAKKIQQKAASRSKKPRRHPCPCCRLPIRYGAEACPFCHQLIEWPSE